MSRPNYIAVVGGVNIDIFGRPNNNLIPKDSNIGKVTLSMGGVGRNIAHNLRLLDCDVKFISCIAGDLYGDAIRQSCKELGIDIRDCFDIKNANTSTYMFISDEIGEMQLAISDMDIYQNLTPVLIEQKLDILNNAAVVVVDANLRQDTLEFIANNINSPLVVDPVSTTKAKKLINILDKITVLKPNKLEAELLSGVVIDDEKSLRSATKMLLEKGVKKVFVSLGSYGVFCMENDEEYYHNCYGGDIKNATGAGDSFVAGLSYAVTHNYTLKQAAVTGLAMASICVGSEQTISPNISILNIENIIKNEKFNIN